MNSVTPKEAKRAVVQLTVLRILVYVILIFLSVLCLFSFVMLFINASRSNGMGDLIGGAAKVAGAIFA